MDKWSGWTPEKGAVIAKELAVLESVYGVCYMRVEFAGTWPQGHVYDYRSRSCSASSLAEDWVLEWRTVFSLYMGPRGEKFENSCSRVSVWMEQSETRRPAWPLCHLSTLLPLLQLTCSTPPNTKDDRSGVANSAIWCASHLSLFVFFFCFFLEFVYSVPDLMRVLCSLFSSLRNFCCKFFEYYYVTQHHIQAWHVSNGQLQLYCSVLQPGKQGWSWKLVSLAAAAAAVKESPGYHWCHKLHRLV